MKIGTLVKPTDLIAYWWEYNIGVVVKIDNSVLCRTYTHKILWDNGVISNENPSHLVVVKHESR